MNFLYKYIFILIKPVHNIGTEISNTALDNTIRTKQARQVILVTILGAQTQEYIFL